VRQVANLRTIALIWLAWALIMISYQAYVPARLQPQRPDYALTWTPNLTKTNQGGEPYYAEPFLNSHVAWDSGFYLSIAIAGYDDPQMWAIPPTFSWNNPQSQLKGDRPDWITISHAFYPFYPLMMRVLMFPLGLLGLNVVATATLSGVMVSLLGTLGAMLALWDLARDEWGDAVGRRAAFYLLIFPAGMFLAEVYTEGLFLGLSFGAIALARRQRWVWVGLLAMAATGTKAAGVLIVLPLVWYWWQAGEPKKLLRQFSLTAIGKALLVCSPILVYQIWSVCLGKPFQIVQSAYFGRGLLLIRQSYRVWGEAWASMLSSNLQARAYYLVEFAAIGLGCIACFWLWQRNRPLAVYSLITILFALTSGSAQGMHRYVMAAPAIFLLPAQWGENEAFDRAWTLANVLLMGVFAATFSFGFWAG
jgi:Mannosyltransferase (PIG-V)